MNKLDTAKQTQIVAALVEGCSIRSVSRMTGASKNTIAKLLVALGAACSEYLDKNLVNLKSDRIQCDEIWSFVGAKQKNVTPKLEAKGPAGDVWTWIAIDADTKLVCSWWVGKRDWQTAHLFVNDLQSRLANRVQLTTDGLKLYLNAIKYAFQVDPNANDDSKWDIDYAVLVKLYGATSAGEGRYSPAKCIGCKSEVKIGDPDEKHISTSYIERQNLTMRMGMRRFTRLTNAFSKKIENHVASLAIHYMHYNFVRIHQTLRVSPAMAAGVSDRLWSIEDLVGLLQ
jgi:IS1 family transposase